MGLIPEEIVSKVIDRSDIVETISSYFPLKRAGRNFKANCPFHDEKTPSFIVNPDKQIFHCFGCNVGGNVVSFIMKQERMEFPEAIRFLAQKVNIEIPKSNDYQNSQTSNLRQLIFKVNNLVTDYFHNNLLFGKDKQSKKAREYLQERKISLNTAKQFRLGFALDEWDGLIKHLKTKNISLNLMEKAGLIVPREKREGYYDRFRNRIIFPIFDTRENCRAFGARSLENKTAKYINSPETIVYTKGHHLFGFHLTKKDITQKDSVIIVEGYLDCITPYQNNVFNIVASLGTALTIEQIRLLRRYTKNVIMLFDMDQAGESAMLRSLDALIGEGMEVKVASLKKGDDPDSFIKKYGVKNFNKAIDEAQILFNYKLNILLKQYDYATVEGKAKIAGEMLPTIDRFKNSVAQSGYIYKLAQRLNIQEQVLMVELKKLSQKSDKRYFKTSSIQNIYNEKRTRAVELDILRLLLAEESFVSATKKEISPDDFQDVRVKKIISKIYELFEEGKSIDKFHLMNSFEDESMQNMISKLTIEGFVATGDKKKMHCDYINRIKGDRLKLKRELLRQQIQEAEASGDQKKLDKLKKEFNQLIKK